MDWDRWYAEGGNYTIYWFATGRRVPDLSVLIGRTLFRRRDEIRHNIFAHNALFRRLKGGVRCSFV